MGNSTDLIDLLRPFQLEKTRQLTTTDWQQQLQILLAERVRYLLQHSRQQLLQILYQVDVSEKKVSFILEQAPIDTIPEQLANLIIQRQLEKLAKRSLYHFPPD